VIGCIEDAFNRPQNHQRLIEIYEKRLREVAAVGGDKLICFPGNRRGMDDEEGLDHCVSGLRPLLPLAEKLGVTMVMELLNSKGDHPDYMADHTAWGVELCHRLASPSFGLLYDIYHMQVMEGDVIATIRRHHDCIVHYHTGGVPGRNEIDATQELNYPAILRAIAETGYSGFVGQEFIPTWPDKLAALREAVRICTV
jgi:hydroxypyruvate isomerase